MTIYLRHHGHLGEYLEFDADAGSARTRFEIPAGASISGSGCRRWGTWYAAYRDGNAATIQIGRDRWNLEQVVTNSIADKGLFRRFTLEFKMDSGLKTLSLKYLRPLSAFIDGTFDEDDDISGDFFVWLHNAIKDDWFRKAEDAGPPNT